MAKITPSALVASISGKIRSDCFQMWKSMNIMRRSPSPCSNVKIRAVEYRTTIAEISSCHYILTAIQKIAWNSYALLLPKSMSGFNSFMARNSALSLATHPDLVMYFNAPTFYSPPIIPSPLGLCYYPDLNQYCLFWTNPNCISNYVQGFYAPQTGYSNQNNPKFRFFETVRSDLLHLIFDASSFPTDTMIRFTARAINLRGEVSLSATALPPPPMPPDVAVLSPNGGEWYYFNQLVSITWRSKEIDTVRIDYSLNNGVSWILIADLVNADLGSQSWTIPESASNICLIKITDTESALHKDQSNSVFEISAVPTLSLTSPVGAESWPALSAQDITWTETNVNFVSLYYSINSGIDWTEIDSDIDASLLTYEWTVVDIPCTTARVKIESDENPLLYSQSPADFTIVESGPSINPIANWIFKTSGYDAGNVRFTDQSGNNHHFTNSGVDVLDDHSECNGSSDYLTLADFTEISVDWKYFSAAFWLKTTDTDGFLSGHSGSGAGSEAWWIAFSGSVLKFLVDRDGDNTCRKRYKSSINCRDGNWHLVGFTFNNGTFRVFIDGIEDTAVTKEYDDAMATINNSTGSFRVSHLLNYYYYLGYLTCHISKGWFFNQVLPDADFVILNALGH